MGAKISSVMSKEPTLEAGSRARPGTSVTSVTWRGTALTNLNPDGHSQQCSPHQDSGNKSIHIQTPVFLVLGLKIAQDFSLLLIQVFVGRNVRSFAVDFTGSWFLRPATAERPEAPGSRHES